MKRIVEAMDTIKEVKWPAQNNRSSIAGGFKALFHGSSDQSRPT